LSELVKRLLVASVGIPLGIFLMMQGGIYLLGFVLVLTFLAFGELENIFRAKDIHIQKYQLIVFTFVIEFLFYAFRNNSKYSFIFFSLICLIYFIFAFVNSLWDLKGFSVLNLSASLFSFLYISLGFTSIIFVREISESNGLPFKFSPNFLLLLIIGIWVCDSAAYFVGRAIGKHKLFPRHSPKKSIEGAVAGLLFSSATIFIGIFYFQLAIGLPIAHILYFCFVVGVLGQAGDLAESQLKRWAEIKDSSNLIPGHGGILDRFDSILLVFPAIAVYFILLSFL